MKIFLLASAFALISAPAFSDAPLVSDADFAKMAAVGNTFEIEEAKVALDRAQDPKLKDFAKQMVADHADALKKLQDAAQKSKLAADEGLDKPHQAMLDNLKTFSGADFDKVYIADQVAAHAETVSLLSDYKQNGKNDNLMSWTDEALPVVKQHRAHIDAM